MIRESEIEEVPEDRNSGRNEQLEIAEPVEARSTEDLLARLPSDNWQDKWMNVASWVTLRNLVWNWNVNDRDPVSEEIEADMQQEQHSEENTANMADPPNEILPIDIVSYPDTTNERCEDSHTNCADKLKTNLVRPWDPTSSDEDSTIPEKNLHL